MTKKLFNPADQTPSAAIREFAMRLIAEGIDPGDLSYGLAVTATRLGRDIAPNAGVALAVAMKAVRRAFFASRTAHGSRGDGA